MARFLLDELYVARFRRMGLLVARGAYHSSFQMFFGDSFTQPLLTSSLCSVVFMPLASMLVQMMCWC